MLIFKKKGINKEEYFEFKIIVKKKINIKMMMKMILFCLVASLLVCDLECAATNFNPDFSSETSASSAPASTISTTSTTSKMTKSTGLFDITLKARTLMTMNNSRTLGKYKF
jgi:hypothetical protein